MPLVAEPTYCNLFTLVSSCIPSLTFEEPLLAMFETSVWAFTSVTCIRFVIEVTESRFCVN